MPSEPSAASPWQGLRRLPGRSPSVRTSGAQGAARLWIDDRQLVQETVRYQTQEIQRFALADIQVVQIRRTVRGMIYNGVLGVPLLLTLLFASTANEPVTERLTVGACVAAPFLILLVVNLLRGPTCRTVLTTALGLQVLSSLSRMRTARRALDTIITGVEAVQGALPPDEAVRLVDRARTPRTPAAPAPGAAFPGYDY